jgi:hypothetical protein
MIPSAIRVKKTLRLFLLQGGLTPGSIMFQSTEEHRVLALSLVLAVFSAYSTLKLAGRLPRKHRGRRVWCLATE